MADCLVEKIPTISRDPACPAFAVDLASGERVKHNKILVGILVAVFLASVAYSFYFRIKPRVDASAYDVIAWNLASGSGYRENLTVDVEHDYAIARVGPLYEFFLAGIYKVFGHRYGPVWVVQAILRVLTVWLAYLMAVLIFKESERKNKIALWTAALFGFYPDLIEISAMLMSETLYLFLVCLMLYLFFLFLDNLSGGFKNKISYFWCTALGVASGLAVLARPPVLLFVPVILFIFYACKKFWLGMVFLAVFFTLFIPWTVRNYATYHKFMPLGAAGAYNLWIGNHAGGNGEQEPHKESLDFMASHKIYELQDESSAQFKSFVISHPVNFVVLCLSRTIKYFSIIRPMGFWFYLKGLGQFVFLGFSGAASVILFIFGLAGISLSLGYKNNPLRYLLVFTLITPVAVIISVVETRYRFQIYPLLAVFAGFFLSQIDFKDGVKNKILLQSAIVVFSVGFIDTLLSFEKFKERLGWFF